MRTKQKRIGSVVYFEYVDPHEGSMQALGIIKRWVDSNGNTTTRKNSTNADIELGSIMCPWNEWSEENCWIQDPFDDEDQYDEDHMLDRCKWIVRPSKEENENSYMRG